MSVYLIFAFCLYVVTYALYLLLSHGLGHKAEYLQLRRFIPCALLAVLPMYLANTSLMSVHYILLLLLGFSWIITYPFLFFVSKRKTSSDFGFHLDTVFGMYLIGWLSSLIIIISYFDFFALFLLSIISLIEWLLLLIVLCQWCHYCLYKVCINEASVMMIFETYTNEVIEFFKSLPAYILASGFLIGIGSLIGIMYVNLQTIQVPMISVVNILILLSEAAFLTIYLWKKEKGVFVRTGILELVLDVKRHLAETGIYNQARDEKLKKLCVSNNVVNNKPVTYILVIGESASRDWMSAFTEMQQDSTPWLKANKDERNFLLYPHAYACECNTVPALKPALTELNQYNEKKFYDSCSIIDIAHKAGYKTYWFSNQSHLGTSSTPISVIANTSDHAQWTQLSFDKPEYDEVLIDNLRQVNSDENNFIVLHLKGSHFNFINRFPQSFSRFSKPGKYDLIPNYLDSLAYSDFILQKVIEYAAENLNLQALVYFSDHAVLPDQRRYPDFTGFKDVHIPLFVYLADDYISKHPLVYETLAKHQDKYWTNDLAYELVCGILDIKSNRYDESNSLASPHYKYTRDMLMTDSRKYFLKDDEEG